MPYVDGFVIPIPTRNLPAYRKMAATAGRIWMEHGALAYYECVGEDLAPKGMPGARFPALAKARRGETVLFSFIVYRSRAHRDKVNALVMKDPRLTAGVDPTKMPFDITRMVYGGFAGLVVKQP